MPKIILAFVTFSWALGITLLALLDAPWWTFPIFTAPIACIAGVCVWAILGIEHDARCHQPKR